MSRITINVSRASMYWRLKLRGAEDDEFLRDLHCRQIMQGIIKHILRMMIITKGITSSKICTARTYVLNASMIYRYPAP